MNGLPGWISRILLLDSTSGGQGLRYWRERILRSLLAVGLLFATFAMIPVVFLVVRHGGWLILYADLAVYLAVLALALAPRISYPVRAGTFLLLAYALGLAIFLGTDFASGGGLIWLFAFSVLSGILMGIRAGLAALFINAVTIFIIGWHIAQGNIATAHPWFSSVERIVTTGANFFLLSFIVTLSGALLVRSLEATLERESDTAARLARQHDQLVDEIAGRAKAEEAIKESLSEKEMLLRELHHRVKNNMQVISSLLDIKRRASGSPEVRAALADLGSQVTSMAVVHELLYQAESVSRIRLSDYIPRLARTICQSFGLRASNIRLELAVEPVELGIDQAIPCALVLNELINNACKHAYPDQRPGRLRIGAANREGGRVEISVIDDGVGLPPGGPSGSGGQGLALATGLVASQLGGDLEVISGAGVAARISFPLQSKK